MAEKSLTVGKAVSIDRQETADERRAAVGGSYLIRHFHQPIGRSAKAGGKGKGTDI